MAQFPLVCWMGLSVGGAEILTPGYVRELALFAITTDGDTAANLYTVVWPVAVHDWGSPDAVQLYDTATGGTLLCTMAPTAPVTIRRYDRVRVPAASYVVVPTPKIPSPYGVGKFGIGTYATVRPDPSLSPAGSGIGIAYNTGGYNVGPYQMRQWTVPLELTFGQVSHICAPGVWAPALLEVTP